MLKFSLASFLVWAGVLCPQLLLDSWPRIMANTGIQPPTPATVSEKLLSTIRSGILLLSVSSSENCFNEIEILCRKHFYK